MIASEIKIFSWVKAKNGKFISCSENVAELQGADSPKQLIGKSDFDLLWRDRAHLYAQEEAAALKGHFIQNYQLQATTSGTIQIFVTKSPLYDEHGDIIGTIGSSIDLTHQYLNKKFGHLDEKNRLHLGSDFCNVHLTAREVDTLRLLLLGWPASRIAIQLNLSRRTIEAYIISMKSKLQCRTKGDIIATCVRYGLNYLTQDLPQDLSAKSG